MTEDRVLTFHNGTCCKCGAAEDLIRISEFGKAVCRDCYPEFVRRRIELTVRRFRMIPRRTRVAVAVSGGADSGSLLHALARTRGRLSFFVTAIHIDMGLGDYSSASREVCEAQAGEVGVPLAIDAVRDHGIEVAPIKGWPTCAVCGAVRRALLPRLARRVGADVIATGHTLDDQLQFMLKNILSGRLAGPAPVLHGTPGWPAKVKPLIQIPDVATETYAEVVGLPTMQEPCPLFEPDTHRFKEVFDILERHAPMGKFRFWSTLRGVMEAVDEEAGEEHPCPVCGEPTRMPVCPICRLRAAQEGRQEPRRA